MADQFSWRDELGRPAVRVDRKLVWILIVIAVVDLLAAAYFSLVPYRLGYLYFEVVSYSFAVLAQCLPFVGQRVGFGGEYSIAGIFWLLVTVFAFIVWNVVITFIAFATHWWTYAQPFTFDVSAVLGLAPIVIGTWKLSAKVRAVER